MKSFKTFLEENKGPCWKGYRKLGMKKKNGRDVPNCVPEEVQFDEHTNCGTPDCCEKCSTSILESGGLWANIHAKRKRGERPAKPGDKDYPSKEAIKSAQNEEADLDEGSESWEAGYKRRVVKTTDPEHKEKGMNWRIKGKDRPEISVKLYKEKPSQEEFNKQMRRVAGHEFGG